MKNYKRIYVILVIILKALSSYGDSQIKPISKSVLNGCWVLVDATKIQDTSTIISNDLLQDIKDFNSQLRALKGSKIYFFDSIILGDNKLKGKPLAFDTLLLGIFIQYQRVPDTDLTERYPGDELADTSSVNHTVGESFMKIIGSNCNFIWVLLANSKQSEYRVCYVNSNRIAIVSLDQNVIMSFARCTQ